MPISHKHKFIFVHIPKNGGTSVERFFGVEKRENLYEGQDSVKEKGVSYSLQHLTCKQLKKHPQVKKYFNNYYKFAIVRNPYERILSEFFWLQKIGRIPDTTNPQKFKNWFNRYYKNLNKDHKLPQYDYIFDEEGNNLVDFIARLENIDDHFKIILKNIKYKNKNSTLKKTNKTKKSKTIIVELIDEEINTKIIELYKKDFDTFNYKKLNISKPNL